MDPVIMIMAGGTMLTLAIAAGYVLGWANKAFHVEVDPRVEEVLAALPGANCGGCGYVGCASYAEAVVHNQELPDKCPVGGESCAKKLAEIMGLELTQTWPYRPVVHCRANLEERLQRHDYRGERTCAGANILSGVQGCTYGCLGFGDCDVSCPFDAIHVVDGLATVDYEKCTGCGNCARVCPRNIITMVPFKTERMLVVGCSNKDFGKDVKAVCSVGCIGCKACFRASEMFRFDDGSLPNIDYEKYDANSDAWAAKAIEKCPMHGLVYVGKPTEHDLEKVKDEELREVVTVDFKTTADDAEWRG